jgi:hypothetical protein
MALQKPKSSQSIGLSDRELAEALGISLERLVDALNEAGLCRCPERQRATAKKAASAAQGVLRTPQEEQSRGRTLPVPRVATMPPPFAQERGFHLGFHLGLS